MRTGLLGALALALATVGTFACGAPASVAPGAPGAAVDTSHGAPADPATLAVPGPAAAPCADDATCLRHRCNLKYGKCAFPCVTDADCARGMSCFKAAVSTCQLRGFGAAAR